MGTFILKRLLHMIPILIGVSLLTFLLMSLTPGGYLQSLRQNPQISAETVERLIAKYHYDKPWYIQYLYWLKNAAQGDFGYSIQYKIPATELITARLWNTFLLSLFATLVAWCIAVPLGIWAAVNKDSLVDRGCSMIAFIGLSVPEILLALLALMFAAATGWFPIGGAQSSLYDLMTPLERFWNRAHHLVLPVLVLAASELAGIMRQMRSNLLDTLRADYVTAARAKGLRDRDILRHHAFGNALLPMVTMVALSAGSIVAGAIVVEDVFSYPGIGFAAVDAIGKRDYPVLQGIFLLLTVAVITANLVADLVYVRIDPRIRSGRVTGG